jgi:hypothetical protein
VGDNYRIGTQGNLFGLDVEMNISTNNMLIGFQIDRDNKRKSN